jgi:hypothetical protein
MSKKVTYRDRLVWHDKNIGIAIDRSGNIHEADWDLDDNDNVVLVMSNGRFVTRAEALKLMEEHEQMAKSNDRLRQVNHDMQALVQERDRLVNTVNKGLDLNSGSSVTHLENSIKVGCKQVSIEDCRKLIKLIKRIAPGKAKKK